MTFEAWLRKQKNRDDVVGDLAKDFIEDYKSKFNRDKIKIKLTRKYLAQLGVRDCVIAAYRQAKREFKRAQELSAENMDTMES